MAQPNYYGGQPPQYGAAPAGYAYAAQPGVAAYQPHASAAQPAYGYPQAGYAQAAPPQPVYYAPEPYSGAAQSPVYGMDPAKPHQNAGAAYATDGAKAPHAVGAAMAPGGGIEAGGAPSSYMEQMEKAVRLGFIRKVYCVLAVQLVVTFAIVAVFSFVDPVRNFVLANPAMLWAAMGVSIATVIALACCTGVARTYPGNYICLALFTLAEAYLVGTIASTFKTDAVIVAVGGTVLITTGLTLFAWQTKIDFTAMSSSIFVIMLSFMFFGIMVAIIGGPVLRLVYACIGLLVFSLFLVYDTQLIIGGKHREYAYGPDDYVIAALNVYMDVIQIFLYLLQIFGSRRD